MGVPGCFRGWTFLSADSALQAHLEDIEAGKDVFMFEETHHLELAKDTLGTDQALKYIRKFFQGHAFAIAGICYGPYDTKGSITNWSIWQILVLGVAA